MDAYSDCLGLLFFFFFWPPAGYRTVDSLLQRMFEAEIPLEAEGPSVDEFSNLSPTAAIPSNVTSESAA